MTDDVIEPAAEVSPEVTTPAPKRRQARAETSPEDGVRVRVLKRGAGRVHKGNGDRYEKGDEFVTTLEIATQLEDAGLVDAL